MPPLNRNKPEQTLIQKTLIIGQWIGFMWSILSVVIVVVSHYLLATGKIDLFGIKPFNVKDHVATALLMFPGVILLGVSSWVLNTKYKK